MEKEPAALGVQSSAAGPDQLWAPGGHRPHLRGPGRVTKQSKPVVSSLQFALQESVLVEKKKKISKSLQIESKVCKQGHKLGSNSCCGFQNPEANSY